MMFLTFIKFVAAFYLSSSSSYAGHENGNCGGGIVCGQGDHMTVELLDFWEAEVLNGIKIERSRLSLDLQLQMAFQRLQNHKFADILELRSIFNNMHEMLDKNFDKIYLPAGIAIAPPEDARNLYIKKGCKLEGIAIYDDNKNILRFDNDLFSKLSQTDRAGLLIHEAVYKYLRDKYGATDSILARHITACAFSTYPCKELDFLSEVPTNSKNSQWNCKAKDETHAPFLEVLIEDLGVVSPDDTSNVRRRRMHVLKLGPGFKWKKQKGQYSHPPVKLFADIDLSGDHGESTEINTFTQSAPHQFGDLGLTFDLKIKVMNGFLTINSHPYICEKTH